MATQKSESLGPQEIEPLAINFNANLERKGEATVAYLTEPELIQLASKIYELLRHELRLERDRW